MLLFDLIDGLSNIDVDLLVGMIFFVLCVFEWVEGKDVIEVDFL